MTGPNANDHKLRQPYALLDAWRGVACLAVISFHAALVVISSRKFPATSVTDGRLPVLYRCSSFGYLGVELFFVISGYCITAAAVSTSRRNAGWTSFAWARFRRIFFTYWIAFAFVFGFSWISSSVLPHRYIAGSSISPHATPTITEWITNLSLTHQFFSTRVFMPVTWSLSYELFFYAIVAAALAARYQVRFDVPILLLLLHLITFGCMLSLITFPNRTHMPFDLWPLFGLGVIAYDLNTNGPTRRGMLAACLVAAQIVAFLFLRPGLQNAIGQPQSLVFPVSLGFAFVCVALFRFDQMLSRLFLVQLLARVGLFSYSLYLVHFVLLGIASRLFSFLPPFPASHYLQFLLSIAFAVVVARFFFLIAERPFLSGAAKKLHRKAQPQNPDLVSTPVAPVLATHS